MSNDNEGLKLTTTGRKQVEEVPYGMYVWRMPDGEVLGDGDGNIMNVFCLKGDRKSQAALAAAAKSYGFEEGTAEWWTGKRRITDEELQEQETREKLGLEPDPLDFSLMRDAASSRG